MTEQIKYAVEGKAAILTLNRPEKMNALTPEMREALIEYLGKADADDNVAAIILRGEGERAFCAGADLSELGTRTWASEMSPGAMLRRKLPRTLEEMDKPVIAAVHGHVLGAGLEVVMASTIRIAADNAKFGLPEINHGVIPGSGGTARLPRLVGLSFAMDMILTGRSINAATALEVGLVSRIVPYKQLVEEARTIAETIGKLSAFAVKAAKAATLQSSRRDLDADIEEERRLFALCLVAKSSPPLPS